MNIANLKRPESNVTTQVEDITPALAAEYLQYNTHNRPLSGATVKKYAKAMTAGKWLFTGESVVFSDLDSLLNGQHRLLAIVESGVTIRVVVVRGIAETSFIVTDTGKKRSGADAVATFAPDFIKLRTLIAAAAKNILTFDEEGTWQCNRTRVSSEDLIALIDKNAAFMQSVNYTTTLNNARKFIPISCIAALHYLFSQQDQEMADTFFHKLNSGEGFTKNDPVLLLRERLISLRHSEASFRTRDLLPFIVKAWEVLREGKEVSRLVVTKTYVPKII